MGRTALFVALTILAVVCYCIWPVQEKPSRPARTQANWRTPTPDESLERFVDCAPAAALAAGLLVLATRRKTADCLTVDADPPIKGELLPPLRGLEDRRSEPLRLTAQRALPSSESEMSDACCPD
jgi:hypothetical protein